MAAAEKTEEHFEQAGLDGSADAAPGITQDTGSARSSARASMLAVASLVQPPPASKSASSLKARNTGPAKSTRTVQSARPAVQSAPASARPGGKARATASARAAPAAQQAPPAAAGSSAKAKRPAAPAAKQYVGRTALHYAHMKGVAFTLRQTARYAGPTRCVDEAEDCVCAHLRAIRCAASLYIGGACAFHVARHVAARAKHVHRYDKTEQTIPIRSTTPLQLVHASEDQGIVYSSAWLMC